MSILDDLLGNGNAFQMNVNPSQTGGSIAALLGSPSQQPAPTDPGLQAPSSVPPSPTQNQDPIVVQGDNWQPTHRNIIGKIGDAILGKPIYENRMRERDLQSAMQDFDPNDPVSTIRRIARIPGQAGTAYKMYEQYGQDKERDQSRDIRNAAKEDMVWTRLGSMAGAATPQNWDAMHTQMVNYVKRWGSDPSDYDIPDKYDENWSDAMSNGSITAAKKAALSVQQQKTDQDQWYRENRLGQIDRHENDSNSHFNTNQGRLTNNHNDAMQNRPHNVMTPWGVPGTVNKDGTQMIVRINGRIHGYSKSGVNSNGSVNWVPEGDVTDQFNGK